MAAEDWWSGRLGSLLGWSDPTALSEAVAPVQEEMMCGQGNHSFSTFLCSLSFCVSANLTTMGEEQPSMVMLWCVALIATIAILKTNLFNFSV